MKTKLKKFYTDHKNEVHIAIVASALTTLAAVAYRADGLKVTNVCYHDDGEMPTINVYLKNGLTRVFHQKPE